jgi:hypothetical protein
MSHPVQPRRSLRTLSWRTTWQSTCTPAHRDHARALCGLGPATRADTAERPQACAQWGTQAAQQENALCDTLVLGCQSQSGRSA